MAKKHKDDLWYTLGEVTCAMAEEMLLNADFGDTEGASYKARVDFYAETMKAGLWRLNGDTIIVSKSGRLLDGRARLRACVKAGVPFPAIVIRNVEDEALITIDAHMKRSARDILTVKDVNIPPALAAAWPIIVGYVNAPNRARFRPHGKASVTPLDIAALTERHPEVIACANRISELRIPTKDMDLPRPVATAALYLLGLADPAKADRFFEILADDLADDLAITPLRRILKDSEAHHHSNTARLALVVKAWNKFVDGKPITMKALRYDGIVERIGGTSGEENFPTISGFPDVAPFDLKELRRLDGIRIVDKSAAEIVRGSRLEIRMVEIEVEQARAYLENNGPMGRNRSLRRTHVKRIAEDMSAGRWRYNGKPIKFDIHGTLLDGQHRCHACVDSKTSFQTLVIEGLDITDFATYDQGRRQGAGVQLARIGTRYGSQHAACATTLWRIQNNYVSGEPSAAAGMEIIQENEGLGESIKLVAPYKHIVQTGIGAALHATFAKIDKEQADEFMLALCKGVKLSKGTPLHSLREKFIQQTTRKVKLPVHADTIREIIVTWNAFRGHDTPFVPQGVGAPNYPVAL